MDISEATDEEERAEWLTCKVTRIEDANGQTVCAAHDLAQIEPVNARLIAAAPEMRDLLLAAADLYPAPDDDGLYDATYALAQRAQAILAALGNPTLATSSLPEIDAQLVQRTQ